MKIYVKAGSTLFLRDDPADALYCVFDDLTPEQQNFVVELAYSDRTMVNAVAYYYFEKIRNLYYDELVTLANKFQADYDIEVDPENFYWHYDVSDGSISLELSELFYRWDSTIGDVNVDLELNVTSGGRVWTYGSIWVYSSSYGDRVAEDVECTARKLRSLGAEESDVEAVMGSIKAAQKFVRDAVKLIKRACKSYPYDDFIMEYLRDSNIKFVPDGDVVRFTY